MRRGVAGQRRELAPRAVGFPERPASFKRAPNLRMLLISVHGGRRIYNLVGRLHKRHQIDKLPYGHFACVVRHVR